MNINVISYSLSGNNRALAESVASGLGARHTDIKDIKTRTIGTTVADLLFGRTPKVEPGSVSVETDGAVVFVGPIWIGSIATPLRTFFKQMKNKVKKYAFVSISGGADGPNPKISAELKKRMGKDAAAVLDYHIADLLPSDPKPTRDDTSKYKVTDADIKDLSGKIVSSLKRALV